MNEHSIEARQSGALPLDVRTATVQLGFCRRLKSAWLLTFGNWHGWCKHGLTWRMCQAAQEMTKQAERPGRAFRHTFTGDPQ